MNGSRFAWAAWALVPVAAAAYHYGPGQADYARDRATRAFDAATAAQSEAEAAQALAYAAHLDALAARKAAQKDPTTAQRATQLTAEEDSLYAAAAERWQSAADRYKEVLTELGEADEAGAREIRWAAAYATVRSGDIWGGIGELEAILEDPMTAPELSQATREELATAYYYGARLLRLSGMPQAEWRVESSKARQHFRYLAEDDGATSPDSQRNLELVLNLEQTQQAELEGAPLPKQCPKSGKQANRKSNCQGKKPGPPKQKQDARGAGGAEEIRDGW